MIGKKKTTLSATARKLYDAMILAMAVMNAVKGYGGTTNFRGNIWEHMGTFFFRGWRRRLRGLGL